MRDSQLLHFDRYTLCVFPLGASQEEARALVRDDVRAIYGPNHATVGSKRVIVKTFDKLDDRCESLSIPNEIDLGDSAINFVDSVGDTSKYRLSEIIVQALHSGGWENTAIRYLVYLKPEMSESEYLDCIQAFIRKTMPDIDVIDMHMATSPSPFEWR